MRRTDTEEKPTEVWEIKTCYRAYGEAMEYPAFNSNQTSPFPLESLSLIDT